MLDGLISWLGLSSAAGLSVLLGTTVVAGLIRGFVGFGAGMIFVPLAATVLGPAAAVGLIWTIDTPITMRYAATAARGANWREIGPLLAGALSGLPLGLHLLVGLDPTFLRWATAGFILVTVTILASGWRYRAAPSTALTFGVGFFSGVSTGLVGIGGPFIALFWLGGQGSNLTIKQNLNAYFGATTLTVGPAFWWQGIIGPDLILASLPLVALYTAAVLVGTSTYNRAGTRSYRPIALAMAATAAIVSLPALDPWLR